MNILKAIIVVFTATQVFASNQYTIEDVQQHNSSIDCWVAYENGVYDLTSYLPLHDRYLNIRSWCGTDMTQAFQTKDGRGEDHNNSSYALLEQYYIGDLVMSKAPLAEDNVTDTIVVDNTTGSTIEETVVNESIPPSKPYNLLLPLILTLIIYWVPSFFIKNKRKFNAFWNTVLLLTLLIPSLGFGIFMILRYQFPNLYNIDFKFMYWHVELSIVFGVIAISHLIQRLKIYLVQLKK